LGGNNKNGNVKEKNMETIRAIVYESNTGYTRKYAEMLSAETGIPSYDRKAAGGFLKSGDEIIFMGWLSAGMVIGFNKAAKEYKVKALCGVGLGAPNDEQVNQLKNRYAKLKVPVFYLRGGFDMERLKGFNKFLMKLFLKSAIASYNKTKDEEKAKMIDAMKYGADFVKKENLAPVISFLTEK